MIEFNIAAKEHEAAAKPDEDVVEVPIDGVTYLARRPTLAQATLLNLTLSQTGYDRLASIFELLHYLIGAEGVAHVKQLVRERRIDYPDLIGHSEQNPNGGLVDLIFAEFTKERPTQPSDDSSPLPAVVGRKSTGRSPGKGSTRSTSRSTGS